MVKKGDRVVVHYLGTLSNGKVFDTSEGREPLQFTVGAGSMIPGFEKAVIGMKVGESKKFTIPAAEAYGPFRKDLVMVVNRDKLPPGLSPKVGDKLQMRSSGGGTTTVTVKEATDKSITVDANHELAGEDLTFQIKLMGAGK